MCVPQSASSFSCQPHGLSTFPLLTTHTCSHSPDYTRLITLTCCWSPAIMLCIPQLHTFPVARLYTCILTFFEIVLCSITLVVYDSEITLSFLVSQVFVYLVYS